MALTTFTSGINTSFSSELNDNFLASGKIQQIYTGTGFDVTSSGASDSDSNSHELTAITSADLGSADYLVIDLSWYIATSSGSTSAYKGTAEVQIQTKDIGGSYADSLAKRTIQEAGAFYGNAKNYKTTRYIHTLTANEKTNGVQVKILTFTSTGSSGGGATITNVQTILSTTA